MQGEINWGLRMYNATARFDILHVGVVCGALRVLEEISRGHRVVRMRLVTEVLGGGHYGRWYGAVFFDTCKMPCRGCAES
jgi:hypothetical protein